MYICVCVHAQRLLPLLSGIPEYVDILHNGLFVSGAVQTFGYVKHSILRTLCRSLECSIITVVIDTCVIHKKILYIYICIYLIAPIIYVVTFIIIIVMATHHL